MEDYLSDGRLSLSTDILAAIVAATIRHNKIFRPPYEGIFAARPQAIWPSDPPRPLSGITVSAAQGGHYRGRTRSFFGGASSAFLQRNSDCRNYGNWDDFYLYADDSESYARFHTTQFLAENELPLVSFREAGNINALYSLILGQLRVEEMLPYLSVSLPWGAQPDTAQADITLFPDDFPNSEPLIMNGEFMARCGATAVDGDPIPVACSPEILRWLSSLTPETIIKPISDEHMAVYARLPSQWGSQTVLNALQLLELLGIRRASLQEV